MRERGKAGFDQGKEQRVRPGPGRGAVLPPCVHRAALSPEGSGEARWGGQRAAAGLERPPCGAVPGKKDSGGAALGGRRRRGGGGAPVPRWRSARVPGACVSRVGLRPHSADSGRGVAAAPCRGSPGSGAAYPANRFLPPGKAAEKGAESAGSVSGPGRGSRQEKCLCEERGMLKGTTTKKAARPGVASASTKDCGEEIQEKWLLASWACQHRENH
uniref:translation initiation factor IF-2-like n=1 Tax=Agelaius phoeniceus TaxID=39638 RepID=UPI0023EB8A38|nr:translation initiation factor IF-2-like [Agelaius phoeniceus]